MSVPVEPASELNDDFKVSLEELMARLNVTDTYDSWRSDWTVLNEERWQTVVITLYSIVILFGCFANLLVVVVIVRYRQLHTVTNIFICYLAIADVALCVFNLPLQLHYQLRNDWIFGRVLCYVAMPTFGVPLFSSSLAILMIAVDRYMLIVYPFKKRMNNRQAIATVAAILLLTVALSTPLIVYVRYVPFLNPVTKETKTSCSEQWPSYLHKQVYSVSIFLLQFVVPICLTSFFYKHICHVLHNRPVRKHDTRRSQRTNRILIAVVLTFTVCWLPWNLYSLTAEFSHRVVRGKYFVLIDLILKVFAMSSACINPFLYGWLNDNFKKELGKFFGYRLCWNRARDGRGTSYSRTTDINNGGVTLKSEMCLRGMPPPDNCTQTP
ncbi:prolactin-releasing peptide receptor [Aplysia californica]|uniref:Prolactin-releasing peptide receptor n=1 Tax=Aplysia californica TaxID=6500 RepID=A0ABM0JYD4_APLCA|nr:prolactin-releasing peptide receptor [Aplysia californica]XP_035827227.1 prolactin-releasing peptide receptor [Aplysia californica]